MFRRSSAVEQLTVNQLVVGSIPTAGAKDFKGLAVNQLGPFSFAFVAGGTDRICCQNEVSTYSDLRFRQVER